MRDGERGWREKETERERESGERERKDTRERDREKKRVEKGTISFPTLLPRWVIESSAIIIQAKARVCAGVGERFEF